MQLDLRLAGTVFLVIFVAELPDKTALAALVLATRYRALPVFFGAALALTLQSVIAIAAGGLLSMLPARAVHVGAGLLFLVSAVFMWRRRPDEDASGATREQEPASAGSFLRTLGATFGVVFIAEWGDLTQLGTAALAARYGSPLMVFAGATTALWAVTALAVLVGNRAGATLRPEVTQKVAAAVFVLVGLALTLGLL
jgi:putative Ca2+/H+ antiporter (TMEM165/GDT1 family)